MTQNDIKEWCEVATQVCSVSRDLLFNDAIVSGFPETDKGGCLTKVGRHSINCHEDKC